MKAPEYKGMIRLSYKHLAKLGKPEFFKNFGLVCIGAIGRYGLASLHSLRFFRRARPSSFPKAPNVEPEEGLSGKSIVVRKTERIAKLGKRGW